MSSECEQYQDKQEQNAKLVRKVFYWSIFCILIGMIVVKSISLLPKSEPDYSKYDDYSSTVEIILEKENDIYLMSSGADDAIMIESSTGGIEITFEIEEVELTFDED